MKREEPSSIEVGQSRIRNNIFSAVILANRAEELRIEHESLEYYVARGTLDQ